MIFKFRTYSFNVQMLNIVHVNNHMRISHRHACHFIFSPIHFYRNIYYSFPFCQNRNPIRLQFRFTHIYPNLHHLLVFNSQHQIFYPAQSFYGYLRLINQTVIIDIFCYTADSISTHLSPGAVRIIHLHFKIGH